MNMRKFQSKDFAEYIKKEALKIIKEEKNIQSLGDPTKLGMNKNVENSTELKGAKVNVGQSGKFDTKAEAPKHLPSDSETKENPTDVKMTERDEGSDGEWSTAAAVKGTNVKKPGTKDYADGLAKPDVTSKRGNPSVTKENDPTQDGGVPGDKDNATEMNKEDKDDKQTIPKTQVIGKGEKTKEGFSKGQTDQEVNVNAKQEEDSKKEKLDAQIQTIQLPESFANKKELITFIKNEANRIAKKL